MESFLTRCFTNNADFPVHPLTIVHVSTERGWHGGEEQARLLIQGLAASVTARSLLRGKAELSPSD